MKLKDKIAIVTGGAVGIGKAIVRVLAQEGAKVVFTYNSHKEEAEKLALEIKGIALQCDVRMGLSSVVNKALEKFGKIDILVNNSGIIKMNPYNESTEDEWRETLEINVIGLGKCIQDVLPYMKEKKSGKIVNISSIAGISGSLNSPFYGASKAAVDGLTKSLCIDVAKYGININSVAPGFTNTDLLKGMKKEKFDMIISQTPSGRIGEPIDIAKVVLFFSSSDSDFVNGQVLVVDGGRLLR